LSHIVTASNDKTARIWDAAIANEITVLRRHDDSVASAVFSPDGSRIVTASNDAGYPDDRPEIDVCR
jgi:WD40 repeat protein